MSELQRATLLLGLDGGASKTDAMLADASGALLGRAQSGGSNLQTIGAAAALAVLDRVVEDVFRAAGIPIQPVAAACLGLAGAGRPADQQIVHEWAAGRSLAQRVLVTTDARLAIAAGTPGDCGVAVICGTGSIAIGRALDGREARAGGWGYLFGDEGSAYDLGVQALRAAAHAADGRGPPTALLDTLLAHWGLPEPSSLIAQIYALPNPRAALADLAPLVARVADAGDEVAVALLDVAGRELALAAEAVARRLDLRAPLPLALAGAVILRAPLLRRALCAELERRGWKADPLTLVQEPCQGALRLARERWQASQPEAR